MQPTAAATVRLRHRALSGAARAGTSTWALAALTSLTVLTACGEKSTVVKEPAPAWQEPSAYTYTLRSTEGERPLIGTFEVTVRDGKVVKTTGLDDSGRRVVARGLTEVPTIAELLRQAETARKEGADIVDVGYAKDGRPTRVAIDREKNGMDDEEAYTLSDYEALG